MPAEVSALFFELSHHAIEVAFCGPIGEDDHTACLVSREGKADLGERAFEVACRTEVSIGLSFLALGDKGLYFGRGRCLRFFTKKKEAPTIIWGELAIGLFDFGEGAAKGGRFDRLGGV